NEMVQASAYTPDSTRASTVDGENKEEARE
ncbi:hypothetical protein LCGC14_1839140, partial [marine sediment metagenome]